MRILAAYSSLVLCLSFTLAATAQTEKESAPAAAAQLQPDEKSQAGSPPAGATRPAEAEKEDKVLVSIGDFKIRESDVEPRLQEILQGSASRSSGMMQQMMIRAVYRPRIIESMVNQWLQENVMPKDAEKAGVFVTEKDLDEELEKIVQKAMSREGWTREQLDQKIQEQGKTLQDLLDETKANPDFYKSLLLDRILQKKFAEKLIVTPDDVKQYYGEHLADQFTQAEQVRASHILVKTADRGPAGQMVPLSDEKQAVAKEKIEQILIEAKKPDADFAALAKKYSEGPSAPGGGDLDFFAKDKMVPEFAEAAFAMQPGQISDIVKSQFGYHIIKVTDRKPAEVTSFAEAKDQIESHLVSQKKEKAVEEYLEELKKQVDIIYHYKPEEPGQTEVPVTLPSR